MELVKSTGKPLLADCSPEDIPHTVSYAVMYRTRIDSFNELSKDKRPPRNLWDKPSRLSEFFDEVFKVNTKPGDNNENFIDFNSEEVE